MIFTGGVPWDEVPAYTDAGDVFAMPCRTRLFGLEPEAFGIVFLEAQACGLPVLAGDSGGASEALAGDAELGYCGRERMVGAMRSSTAARARQAIERERSPRRRGRRSCDDLNGLRRMSEGGTEPGAPPHSCSADEPSAGLTGALISALMLLAGVAVASRRRRAECEDDDDDDRGDCRDEQRVLDRRGARLRSAIESRASVEAYASLLRSARSAAAADARRAGLDGRCRCR